jgi:uncharacterized protein
LNKFLIITLLLSFHPFLEAQDSTGSLAFRKNRPSRQSRTFYQPDLSYRIWQQFKLVQEANSGDPLAQHELGLRYLLGDGQTADTVKAAEWIKKAAQQKLPAAAFNYGILLFNGWGTEWNPFEAYKNFLIAAKDTMAQALYIVGVLHTDNLIVPRDWGKAYYYVKQAADKGYEQAVNVLPRLRKQLPPGMDTTGKMISYKTSVPGDSPGLVFIDFDHPVTSLSDVVSDSLIFEDLLLSDNREFDSIITMNGKPVISFDSSDIKILRDAASWGAPEAHTLLGYLSEKGVYIKKNVISSAAYYIRGAKLDSYRSKLLLMELIKDEAFVKELKDAALRGEPEAMFAWYGLSSFSLDNSITEKDAVNLLIKSADKGYLPAIVELGLLYYTGRYFEKNIPAAVELWTSANRDGNNEAGVRVAASVVYNEVPGNIKNSVQMLRTGNNKGSLLAQVALAHSIEQGLEKPAIPGEDIKFYRSAAQRGNRFAFSQLERKHDSIRPDEQEFRKEE